MTVLTPTYNRAHTLHRVYQSLVQQTGVDFEWLVVDDGSTDHTAELVQRWAQGAPFPTRYVPKPNGGKHTAIHRALEEIESPYTVILDSDDSCVPGALHQFLRLWDELPSASRDEWGVVTVLCQDESGAIVGTPFPGSPFDSTYYEMVVVHGMRGDKWECYRTMVLREFPFPQNLKESAVPEGIILGRIGTRYRTRYVNLALRVYHNDGLDTSIVRSSDPRRNAVGRFWAQRENLTVPRFLFWRNPRAFLVFGVKYARMAGLARVGLRSALGDLRWRLSRCVALAMWIPGRLVAARELMGNYNASGAEDRLTRAKRGKA